MQKTIEDILIDGTKEQRVFLCSEDFQVFFQYYFSDFFSYKVPRFHIDMFDDLWSLVMGVLDVIVWVMFRESAKTTILKAFVVWCICYNKRRFINYDCYDKDNAEAALFDIAVWLQTNPKIIRDFGHLYYAEKKEGKKQSDMKRINEFITTNGVKLKAYSTQKSTRGRIFGKHRPDLYVVDDFETETTKDSFPATQKVIKHIDSLKAGAGPGAWIIYLCNLISESGSVAHVMANASNDPRAVVRKVDVVDARGNIVWPDKYVKTDAEAVKLNAMITDSSKRKISLEDKRRKLGDDVFEQEMMNNPAATSDIVFDRDTIDRLLEKAKDPVREVAGFRLWDEFNPKHRYALASDSAEGVGRDSSTTALIDFTVTPNVLVGNYKNNKIAPDIFAYEIKRQAEMFSNPLVAPEINNQGFATVAILKTIYPIGRIYKKVQTEKVTGKVTEDIGYKTNGSNKSSLIYNLKTAIEDGDLVIYDKDTLNEARAYTLNDMAEIEYKDGMTRHFDLLMAAAICWEMRNHALTPDAARKKYVPKQWNTISSYEGK